MTTLTIDQLSRSAKRRLGLADHADHLPPTRPGIAKAKSLQPAHGEPSKPKKITPAGAATAQRRRAGG